METYLNGKRGPSCLAPGDHLGAYLARMKICSDCLELYESGSFRDMHMHDPHDRSNFSQECSCSTWILIEKYSISEITWNGSDFNRKVEMCWCCSRELINSGSKWSPFFCEDCKAMVMSVNSKTGKVVIPIGRHSLMNSIVYDKQNPEDDDEAKSFFKSWQSLVVKIDHLHRWSKVSLRNNLHELVLDTGEDISLEQYDVRLPDSKITKQDSFYQMMDFFQKSDTN